MIDIKDFEGLYAIQEDGKVWSYRFNKYLSPFDNGQGYAIVNLFKDGKHYKRRVHRLVAETFIPNPDNLLVVNHLDENKQNNHISNLAWVSHSENVNYSKHHRNPKKLLPVVCVELDQVFRTQVEAANELGIGRQSIWNALHNRQNTAGGYHWRYVEADEAAALSCED